MVVKERRRGWKPWSQLTDEERAAITAKRRAAWEAKSDSEKAAVTARLREQGRARWLARSEEEREAIRERSRQAWRQRHPERAAVRDRLLENNPREACQRCGSADSVLFVTDYQAEAFVWLCRTCAAVPRSES